MSVDVKLEMMIVGDENEAQKMPNSEIARRNRGLPSLLPLFTMQQYCAFLMRRLPKKEVKRSINEHHCSAERAAASCLLDLHKYLHNLEHKPTSPETYRVLCKEPKRDAEGAVRSLMQQFAFAVCCLLLECLGLSTVNLDWQFISMGLSKVNPGTPVAIATGDGKCSIFG